MEYLSIITVLWYSKTLPFWYQSIINFYDFTIILTMTRFLKKYMGIKGTGHPMG